MGYSRQFHQFLTGYRDPVSGLRARINALITCRRLEETIGKACSRHSNAADFAAWKKARQWVDDFTAEYLQAVREWREGIEAQLPESTTFNRDKDRPGPLILSRTPG